MKRLRIRSYLVSGGPVSSDWSLSLIDKESDISFPRLVAVIANDLHPATHNLARHGMISGSATLERNFQMIAVSPRKETLSM